LGVTGSFGGCRDPRASWVPWGGDGLLWGDRHPGAGVDESLPSSAQLPWGWRGSAQTPAARGDARSLGPPGSHHAWGHHTWGARCKPGGTHQGKPPDPSHRQSPPGIPPAPHLGVPLADAVGPGQPRAGADPGTGAGGRQQRSPGPAGDGDALVNVSVAPWGAGEGGEAQPRAPVGRVKGEGCVSPLHPQTPPSTPARGSPRRCRSPEGGWRGESDPTAGLERLPSRCLVQSAKKSAQHSHHRVPKKNQKPTQKRQRRRAGPHQLPQGVR